MREKSARVTVCAENEETANFGLSGLVFGSIRAYGHWFSTNCTLASLSFCTHGFSCTISVAARETHHVAAPYRGLVFELANVIRQLAHDMIASPPLALRNGRQRGRESIL